MSQEFPTLPELLAFAQLIPPPAAKAFCRLGLLASPVAQAVAKLVGSEETIFNLLIDSDAVRHTFAQHGPANSKFEAARGQIPIQERDILALAGWLPALTSVAAGQARPGKQPRVEATRADNSGITVVVLEWRPGRQQLALVTMYKKRPAT